MSLDINLENSIQPVDAPDVQFKDWQTPSVPMGTFGTLPNFSDTVGIPMPDSSQNKPFPDYAVIEPDTLMNFLGSIGHAGDVGLGIAKQFIPGVGGAGDLLGGLGGAIDNSGAGGIKKGVEGVLGAGEGLVGDVAGATLKRIETVAGEVGRTFDSSNPDAFKFLDAPFRLAGAAALGETGARAFDFGRPIDQSVWDKMPADLMDSLKIASIVPAMKAIGVAAKGAAAVGDTGLFMRGLTHSFDTLEGAQAAEKVGAITGRVFLGVQGAGLAAEFALPKIDPNEPWAQNILNNRVVADASPWRMPFEVAMTLPLDVAALGKFISDNRVASYVADKVLGAQPLPTQLMFTQEEMNNAIKGGILTDQHVSLLNDYAFRQVAENKLVELWNAAPHLGEDAKTIKDLPWSQEFAVKQVNNMVGRMLHDDPKAFAKDASDLMRDRGINGFQGWGDLDTAGKLQQWRDYADRALEWEAKYPDRLVTVNSGAAFADQQAAPLLDYLENAMKNGKVDMADITSRYPAWEDMLKPYAHDPEQMLMQVKNAVGGGTQADLNSARASLREANEAYGRIQDQMATLEGPGGLFPMEKWPIGSEQYSQYQKWSQQANAMELKVRSLENEVMRLSQPSQGALEYRLDSLNKRIIGGETSLSAERNTLTSKLQDLRAQQAEGLEKQIDTLQGSMVAREAELTRILNLPEGEAIRPGLDAEYDMMNRQISDLTKQWFEAKDFQGTRWQLSINEGKPVMRLMDKTGLEWTPENRTLVGQAFDRLFAGIPNKELAFDSMNFLRNELGRAGNSPETISEFINQLRLRVEENAWTSRTGFSRSQYGSIYHLPPNVINKIATPDAAMLRNGAISGIKVPSEYKNASELIYRSFPGPLKIFQKYAIGKSVDVPYNSLTAPVVHTLGRTLYPMFRFYLSARFLAMNFMESPIIGAALGGEKFVNAPLDPALMKFAKNILGADRDSGHAFGIVGGTENFAARNLAKLAYVKRPDEVVSSILKTVQQQPEMKNYLEGLGYDMKTVTALNEQLTNARTIYNDLKSTSEAATKNPGAETNAALQAAKERAGIRGVYNLDDFAKKVTNLEQQLNNYQVTLGSKDTWYNDLAQLLKERTDIIDNIGAKTKAEQALQQQIGELQLNIKNGLGDKTNTISQIQDLQKQLDKATSDRRVQEAMYENHIQATEHLQPFIDGMKYAEQRLVQDMRTVFYGNPSRSSTERLLNSFLLYWPLSYQLKATKDMVQFMGSRAFGFPTGSSGAMAWREIRAEHDRKLQNDPEYAQFFASNKHALDLMRQLLPITPEDVGVTLSPETRGYHLLAGGGGPKGKDMTPKDYLSRATNIGPIRDLGETIPGIVTEQLKPGGLYYELTHGGQQ